MPDSPRPLSLDARFESALGGEAPFAELYAIAESLRDAGLAQADIYRIYLDQRLRRFRDQQQQPGQVQPGQERPGQERPGQERPFGDESAGDESAGDESAGDPLWDVLDCIWSGGWGKAGPDLFDRPLTEERVKVVEVDLEEPSMPGGPYELTVDHPQLYLRFAIDSLDVIGGLLDFFRSMLHHRRYGELRLGTLGDATVSIIKDDERGDRFFWCVRSPHGCVRHTIDIADVGDYVAGLQQAADALPRNGGRAGKER